MVVIPAARSDIAAVSSSAQILFFGDVEVWTQGTWPEQVPTEDTVGVGLESGFDVLIWEEMRPKSQTGNLMMAGDGGDGEVMEVQLLTTGDGRGCTHPHQRQTRCVGLECVKCFCW